MSIQQTYSPDTSIVGNREQNLINYLGLSLETTTLRLQWQQQQQKVYQIQLDSFCEFDY